MAVDVGSAVGYLDLDISKFLSGLKSAQDEAGKTSTTITQKLDSVGTKFTSIGKKMTALVTTPIVGAGTAAMKTAANFESAMSKVSAISGSTGKDLEALSNKAKEMGETTKFSASESAEALQYMAMAGWKTEDMLDGLEGIMNLAAASGEDLATTSDIVTDALTAFGLKAKDSSHFADVLAAASSNANTNVSMLGESFKYVAPLAGALNYSVEDVGVALGLMANAGIKAGQAGTSLRSAISGMISPSKDAVGWMEELNLTLTNEDGTMKSLAEVMDMLRENMGDLSEAEQAQAASAIFGERAMSGMLAIVNAAPEDYDKLTKALENADGTAKNMADTMNDNLNGQLTLLKSQIEGVAIKLGNILMPTIKKVVDKISQLVDWFSNLSQEQQKTILKIAGIVAAIGPLLLIIGKTIKTISSIIKIVNSVKTAVIALNAVVAANPIVLIITAIIAAIGALVAVFVHFYKTNEEFRNKVNAAWEKIKEVVGVVIDFIKKIWQGLCDFLGPIFEAAWERIKLIVGTIVEIVKKVVEAVKPYIEAIGEAFAKIFDFIKKTFGAMIESLKPLFKEIIGAFQEAWEVIKLIWDKVAPYFEAIWKRIKLIFSVVKKILGDIFKKAWERIKAIWSVVGPYFKKIWEGIKKTFSVVGKILGGFFKVAWTAIKAVWDVAVKFFTAIWAGIKAVFSVVKAVLSGNFKDAWEAIKNVWNKVVDFFKSIWDGIKKVFSAVASWFKDIFKQAFENIKTIWNGVTNFFSGIWDGIKNVFSKVGTWFKDKFKEAVDNIILVWSVVHNFFQKIWDGIKDIFAKVGNWFKEKFQEAVDNIKAVFIIIKHFFQEIWDAIKNVFSNVGGWFKQKFQDAVDNIKAVFTIIKNFFSGIWDGIKSVFSNVGSWFKDKFQNAYDNIKAVFTGIKTFFEGIWDKIKSVFSNVGSKIGEAFSSAFKTVVNHVFEFIENRINTFIDNLNGIVYLLNKIPNVDMDPVSHVSLPRLAKGGLAYGPMAAIVGDNKNARTDPEVISPLSKLKSIISKAMAEPLNKISDAQKKMEQSVKSAMQTKIIDITPLLTIMQEMVDVQKANYSYNLSSTKQVSRADEKQNHNNYQIPSGDTFNFYTTKQIDEQEAARQVKRIKRDLIEGF